MDMTPSRLIAILAITGGLGLATLGISRAQNTPVDSEVTVVTASATTTAATDTTKPMTHAERHQAMLEEQAKLFNLSVDDLKKEIDSGKPFYQIAAEHGVTNKKLQEQHRAEFKAKLNDMVKVGFLTQEEADAALKNFDTRMAEGPMIMGGPGFGRGFGHHGGLWMK